MGGRKNTLTGAVLKNTAYVTMLIDHFFAVIFLNYMKLHTVDGGWDPQLERIYRMGRAVGRTSFILFAFLIVEGFLHTRSRARFLARVFLFALVSEVPFDLAFTGNVIDWKSQNIFWTLLIGLIVLSFWEYLSRYGRVLRTIGRAAVLAAGCAAAFVFSVDYRFMGVLLIFVLYQTRENNVAARFLAAGAVMLFGTWGANLLRYEGRYTAEYLFRFSMREMYGLLAFAPIALYNGEKGRQLPKSVYYAFYPAHLLLLYGVAKGVGVM